MLARRSVQRAVQQSACLMTRRMPLVKAGDRKTAAVQSLNASATKAERLYVLDLLPAVYRCIASAEKQSLTVQQPSVPHASHEQPHVPAHKFMMMLLDLIRRKHDAPTHMAVVVDVPGPKFRHLKWSSYKARRPQPPPQLRQEVSRILSLVEAMGIPVLTVPGVEADDVCGSLAVRALHDGFQVILVSPDKDYNQLLQQGLSLLRYERSGPVLYTCHDFAEEFGLPADQAKLWVDVKAFEGDPGDNIPGVKGIGEKTAVQLVKELGTVEDIFERLEERLQHVEQECLKLNKKQAEMLLSPEGAAAAKLSKELITIATDLKAPPIRQSWEKFRLKAPPQSGKDVIDIANSNNLHWISGRLRELFDEWGQVTCSTRPLYMQQLLRALWLKANLYIVTEGPITTLQFACTGALRQAV